jgi:GNAT superfamily N-acetyltransferase
VRALLRYQDEPMPYESFCAEERLLFTGLNFWQHWLPCHWHVAPSVYLAKEDGIVLGLISLRPTGKSKNCWQVDHLVIHPNQRGRGIAQELLRFAFALFGSQGVGHFVAEISDQNPAALGLLGSCGFRRCARITHYQVPADLKLKEDADRSEGSEKSVSIDSLYGSDTFRLAVAEDQASLLALHQAILPPDLRKAFSYVSEDFRVFPLQVESLDKLARRLIRRRSWFWVQFDPERKVITSACRVTAHHEGDYHLEFAVHPGWTHTAKDLVNFVLSIMRRAGMKGMVIAKAYDYQGPVVGALEEAGLVRVGNFSLMARDHWLRAKTPKPISLTRTVSGLGAIGKPAINIPRTIAGTMSGTMPGAMKGRNLPGIVIANIAGMKVRRPLGRGRANSEGSSHLI